MFALPGTEVAGGRSAVGSGDETAKVAPKVTPRGPEGGCRRLGGGPAGAASIEPMQQLVVTLDCPDRPGIVGAAVLTATIVALYDRSRQAILDITSSRVLLDEVPWLQRSIVWVRRWTGMRR